MTTETKTIPGSVNSKEITEAIKAIELYTLQYKKKRMNTENYITSVHTQLSRLTNTRDYLEYLKNIGQ
jgi:hypothetical protein